MTMTTISIRPVLTALGLLLMLALTSKCVEEGWQDEHGYHKGRPPANDR